MRGPQEGTQRLLSASLSHAAMKSAARRRAVPPASERPAMKPKVYYQPG